MKSPEVNDKFVLPVILYFAGCFRSMTSSVNGAELADGHGHAEGLAAPEDPCTDPEDDGEFSDCSTLILGGEL